MHCSSLEAGTWESAKYEYIQSRSAQFPFDIDTATREHRGSQAVIGPREILIDEARRSGGRLEAPR